MASSLKEIWAFLTFASVITDNAVFAFSLSATPGPIFSKNNAKFPPVTIFPNSIPPSKGYVTLYSYKNGVGGNTRQKY